jgi:ribosomal protein L11 methylase PrmA
MLQLKLCLDMTKSCRKRCLKFRQQPEIARDQAVDKVFDIIKGYRIADLVCGSGVFLTAALVLLSQKVAVH